MVRLSDQLVEGKACRWDFLVFPLLGDDSVAAAFANALDKSPEGTTGLADARIAVIWPWSGRRR